MAEVLNVSVREKLGSSNSRRLRQSGNVPAVLYGRKAGNIHLSIPADDVVPVLRRGIKLVNMKGAATDMALIQEVQWDPFGLEVLHLDLTRVSADEKVQIATTIELRGEAPGTKDGGQTLQMVHSLQVECKVTAIPEKLEINVNSLGLNEMIRAGEVEIPADVVLLTDPEIVVVQCMEVVEAEDEEPADMLAIEPEVIGRKEDEEGESSS